MTVRTIEIRDEILALLNGTRLGTFSFQEQVAIALSVQLFLQGSISLGKAAELAKQPRISFELLLAEMGIPTVQYDQTDYEEDQRTLATLFQHSAAQ
ncbi:MAG: UPF0175 family protein [Dehalococcoidia bacterium]